MFADGQVGRFLFCLGSQVTYQRHMAGGCWKKEKKKKEKRKKIKERLTVLQLYIPHA